MVDVQADHPHLDDWKGAVGRGPRRPVGESGMQPAPGVCDGGAADTCVGDVFGVRGVPGAGLREDRTRYRGCGPWCEAAVSGPTCAGHGPSASGPAPAAAGPAGGGPDKVRRIGRPRGPGRPGYLPAPGLWWSAAGSAQPAGNSGGGFATRGEAYRIQRGGPGAAPRLQRADARCRGPGVRQPRARGVEPSVVGAHARTKTASVYGCCRTEWSSTTQRSTTCVEDQVRWRSAHARWPCR
ncbi:hypothetical protein SAMN05216483_5669 [Streptomyces sp. 2131.1]|nr:hypothetical protein SAMN05216483_5669 [Streptomyces sp. 2131.1]